MNESTYAFPASFAQQRLWFVDRLLPGNPFYNLHAAISINARVDGDAMARTLQTIADRHETLRTSFADDRGTPMQIVHPRVVIDLTRADLRGISARQRSEAAHRLSVDQAERPFDLDQAPLVRASLAQFADEDFILLLTIHHIIADGWSLGVLMREIKDIYAAYALNRECPLPPLPIQYADFAIWQRDWLQGAELDGQLTYWRSQLDDLPQLELLTDRLRPRVATFRCASHTFRLPDGVQRAVMALDRSQGLTPFMVLLGGFVALLHRYTGQTDIAIGSPIANRTSADVEGLIGFFVNTLVLRTRVDGNPDFIELLRRVRETTLGAYMHQSLPFERLVDELRPDRDLGRNPLIQVMFQLHNAPTLGVADSTQTVPLPQASRGLSPFDLALDVWPTRHGFEARVDYSTDLFDPATVEALAKHYCTLLGAAAADPHVPVSRLPLLDDNEYERLASGLHSAPPAYPREACIHELFEQCAASRPEAVALAFGSVTMTYAELNARADQIAAALLTLPHGGPRIVGIAIERSLDMVAGLLGILKSGLAYLALDPTLPPNRLRLLVGHAQLRYALCDTHGARALVDTGCEIVRVESIAADHVAPRARPRVAATDLAYVAYTSGSTGEPKGVCVPHRAVVRLVRNQTYVDWSPNDVYFQFSPLPFDASTFEIWGSLLNGARLAIHEPGAASLEELGRSLQRHGVTTLWLSSGLFNQMVDSQIHRLDAVRQLLAGGDVLSAAHVRKALEAPGTRVIVNGYGPTEGTTFTTCARFADPSTVPDSVPIGRPLSGTRVYVVDDAGNPVPVGVAGELFVGGDGVAVEYLNAPALTNERFVRDRLPGTSGTLYRTGDRVRWRHDGMLEFLGRRDQQVKLRGFRVEPGEIEAVLKRHVGVADATVVVGGEGEDRRLVAYVVPGVPAPVASELRAYLDGELPSFMVPSGFVLLDALPITPNGKVDVRRLPPPLPNDGSAPAMSQQPASDLEIAVADIWREVLRLEHVGVHANFFRELGGHSLLATQVVSRLREQFDIELPLRCFFESPTIAQLAVRIEGLLIADVSSLTDDEARALLTPMAAVSGSQIVN